MSGKIAIVTGARGRQGAAITRLFALEGAIVFATDLAPLPASAHDRVHWLELDVAREDGWQAVVRKVVERHGRIDILINNAAIFPRATIEAMTVDEYDRVIAVNQRGVWLGMKAVLGAMRAAGGGTIVNTVSLAGMIGIAGMSAYVASKHAVRGMSRTAAAEFGRDHIRVNAVFPGAIVGADTGVPPHAIDALFSDLPLGRPGSPEEVARMMIFLASDESSYCTGSEFLIDGGALANPVPPPSPADIQSAIAQSKNV